MKKKEMKKDKAIVIFPGWGTPFSFYEDFFISKLNSDKKAYKIIYIDLNKKNVFTRDFKITLKKKLKQYNDITFFAWSLGAMIALMWQDEFQREILISQNIYLSPTLNFTKTTSPIILKKMIRDLQRDKNKVLENFMKMNFSAKKNYINFMEKYKKDIYNLNKNSLKKGLDILSTSKLYISKIKTRSLILTGNKDKIIPRKNTDIFLNKFENYKYKYYNKCGHNILYEKNEEVLDLIRSFLND
ncbi:MAG: alpha/beta fold hydrolase [Fusobacteriota bacterium]